MIRSITSAWPGIAKRNCSESSASVGGLPEPFWYWAAYSGILKKVLNRRFKATRSSGALKTSL